MNQFELLARLVDEFERLEIAYMIGGSQASIYYGEPRYTNDIDVVADLRPEHVSGLLAAFPFPEFYLDAGAVQEAIRDRRPFNIIHPESGLKIDVIIPRQTLYDRTELGRRQTLPLVPGREAYFARPEDVILYKMIYYREGLSEKHLRDIAGILQISGDEIDRPYIERWAQELGLLAIWEAALRRLGSR